MSDVNNGGTAEKVAELPAENGQKRERSSIAFPYLDLNDAIEVADTIHKNVGTGSCSTDQLAPWLKQSPSSSAFRQRITTSRNFGLTDFDGPGNLKLTDLGRMVVDPKRQREACASAFLKIPLYQALFDKFKGSVLPPTLALEREIVALGVAEKQKDRARQVFERSAQQAGFFEAGRERLVRPGFAPSTEPDVSATGTNEKKGGGDDGGGTGLSLDPLLTALLQKIPSKQDGWPAAKRVRWFRTFAMNVSQIYDDDDSPVELKIEEAKAQE